MTAINYSHTPQPPNISDEWQAAINRGWSVLPLCPKGPRAKQPLISCVKDEAGHTTGKLEHDTAGWKYYQTHRPDAETLARWETKWPDRNIGIATGATSGIVVLDVDGPDGEESLAKMGTLPRTPCVKTARGQHHYFRHPGCHVGNFVGQRPGLDFRGDGGYVVGAGSVHKSGHIYQWIVTPEECPLAEMPQWLLDLVGDAHEQPQEPSPPRHDTNTNTLDNGRAFALAALAGEARKVEDALDGTRHNRLLKSAIASAGFVGILSEHEIEDSLFKAFSSRPYDPGYNPRATIRDGITYGVRRPREIPKPTIDRIRISPPPKRKATTKTAAKSTTKTTTPAIEDIGDTEANEGEGGEDVGSEGEIELDEEVVDLLRSAPLTDAGNAQCMIAVFGDSYRYDHNRKLWMAWAGNRWVEDEKSTVDQAALAVIRARQQAAYSIEDTDRKKKVFSFLISSENAIKRKGMLQTASTYPAFATTIGEYDRDPWLAIVPQGSLDLRTGELSAPRREDLITKSLGTDYDPAATAPRWERFLREIFNGDEELIDFIQRAMGHSLTGDTREQCIFLCHGKGANGKSVFLDTLRQVIGDYAGNAAFSTFDADRHSDATNDLAMLRGTRFVTVIEADEDRRLAEARVKAVTGQDPITCRFLYGQFFTYMPTYKLWMAMNHKPIIRGTDRGIWRRIKLIPFTQDFEGREDKQLAQVLRTELPGILNWMLAGLQAWRTNGLGTAQVIEKATEEYRLESDLVGQWFADCCMRSSLSATSASDAYNSYRDWCRAYGYHDPTQNSFGRSLVEKGFVRFRNQAKRSYQGFLIVENAPRTY
jgi:putative DNA primase/helicase